MPPLLLRDAHIANKIPAHVRNIVLIVYFL